MIRLAAIFTLMMTATASAQMYCARPDPPSCMEELMLDRSEANFQLCRDEIEEFRTKVRDYNDCLTSEQNDMLDELKKTIAQFNACTQSEVC
jgi:hypothetical protein